MRNQPETTHAYNIPRLNWVFLASSAAALVVTVWMIYNDWDRDWKTYQQKNNQIEIERAREELETARQASKDDVERLNEQIKKQQSAVDKKRGDLKAAHGELEKNTVAASNADVDYKFAKADLDAAKSSYQIEETDAAQELADKRKIPVTEAILKVRSEDHIRRLASALSEQTAKVNRLDAALQEAEARKKAAQAKVDDITGVLKNLEKERSRLLADQDKAQKKLASLDTSGAKSLLDAPLLESFVPSLRVDQKILDNVQWNLNFAMVPRVDRCTTCHVNAEKKVNYPVIVSKEPADNKPVNPDDVADLVDQGKTKGWVDRKELHDYIVKNLGLKKGVTAGQLNSILNTLREGGVEYRDFYRKLDTPFASHPMQELFVGTESPHPADKFGCTSCHWGWDRDVRFSGTAHTPDPEKHVKVQWENKKFEGNQHDYWVKRYHWEENEDIDQKMRPAKFIESSCLKCHINVTEVPRAEKLNRGLQLIEQAGCWECHRIKQLEHSLTHKVQRGETLAAIARLYNADVERIKFANNLTGEPKLNQELSVPVRQLQRTGPSLSKVAGKVSDQWIRKWLENPKAFRTNSFMPRFWGLNNNNDSVHYAGVRLHDVPAPDRNNLEMEAIASFVLANSEKPAFPTPPDGDAKHGQELFSAVGCLGCHVTTEKLGDLKADPRKTLGVSDDEYRRLRSQGPMLAGIGSKASPGWIYAWIKNPKGFSPQTRMPNLRLNDQEAADITAYLATLKHNDFDKRVLPTVRQEVLDDTTEEFLRTMLPYQEAREIMEGKKPFDPALAEALRGIWSDSEQTSRLKGVDAQQKKRLFLGAKLVQRYGCYSCHEMRGFETTKAIGTELSEWGSKATDKLAFGYLEKHIEHNNYAYLSQKLSAPRSFDTTDVLRPQEWMKMPQYDFTPEQIEQISTAVMGMTDEKVTDQARRNLSGTDWDIETGRWIAERYNCRGCHVLEHKGGGIRATIDDPAFYPPDLFAEGARTQPEWLFKFLKEPTSIRPRLFVKSRMPTFQLTDEETNALVKYFNFIDRQDFPFERNFVMGMHADPEMINVGKALFEKLQCVKCHSLKPGEKLEPELANRQFPSLVLVKDRLKPQWVNDWLRDPNYFQKGTQMPAFWVDGATPFRDILGGNAAKQMEAVTQYMFTYQGEDLGKPLPPQSQEPTAPAKKPAANQYE